MIQRIACAASLTLAAVAALSSAPIPQHSSPNAQDTVSVQLLAFNDFHGNLDPPTGSNGRIGTTEAGGIEYLAAHLARLEARNPNTLIVSAGDNIGASPLLSGLFHDEPTIEALTAAGLDVSTTGNHEFDEGWAELYRMQHGGCHPVDGCQDNTPFAGAGFQYLSANVVLDPRKVHQALIARTGIKLARPDTLLPGLTIKEIGGVKIGFIGLVLKGTPQLVQPTGVVGLTFRPEAETVNKLLPALKRERVRAIVVLIHEGGFPAGDDFSGCPGVSGAIVEIAKKIKDDVDVIVSGHTHQPYNCTFGKKLVTSAASFGRLITSIDLKISRADGEIVSKTAQNIIVTRDIPKSAAMTAILDRYRPFYTPLANKTIGTISRDLVRALNNAGESPLGDVVADAMLEAARDPTAGGAVVALMNPGGIRGDISRHADVPAGTPSPVSYSDVFNIHPFQNRLIVKTLTGDMIRRVLEQQFDNRAAGNDMVLQVSDGFTYSYDRTKPKGSRVDTATMKLHGQTVMPKQKYRVATMDFLWDGGDNFTVFLEGTDPVPGGLDVDVVSSYIGKHSPAVPGPANRIARTQ